MNRNTGSRFHLEPLERREFLAADVGAISLPGAGPAIAVDADANGRKLIPLLLVDESASGPSGRGAVVTDSSLVIQRGADASGRYVLNWLGRSIVGHLKPHVVLHFETAWVYDPTATTPMPTPTPAPAPSPAPDPTPPPTPDPTPSPVPDPQPIPMPPPVPPPDPMPTPPPAPSTKPAPNPYPDGTRIGNDVWPPQPTGGSGLTVYSGATLWGDNGTPDQSDFVQEWRGDCYAYASWRADTSAAAAQVSADSLPGWYVVTFNQNGRVTRVHVDTRFPAELRPTAGGAIGGIVLEKALVTLRGGTSWESLDWGLPDAVLFAEGRDIVTQYTSLAGAAATWTFLTTALADGKPLVNCTNASTSTLVSRHCYTVDGAWIDADGVGWVHLNNPWGYNDATVTLDQYRADTSSTTAGL